MEDLALNSNFSVHLDDRNDLATVSDRAAFEQSVVMMLTDFMYDSILGSQSRATIREKIKLEVTRVVREHSLVESVRSVEINEKVGAPDTFEVEISYASSDEASFTEDVTVQ